ncbi:MAG: DUF6057 family protein [Bacteroidales bacterium]|nr:DUF6057 family protein [Bacteroidales bacterium]
MTNRKNTPAAGEQQPVGNSQPAKARRCNRQTCLIYGIGFLLLAVFCCWTYGDVFRQIAEEDFVCSDAEAMTFVRRLSMGYLYWGARYVLLVFKNQWLGGILMAALLTLSAWLFDRLLPASKTMLRGLGFLPVVGLLSWMVYRGYNLFLRCEISTFVIQVLALFAVALVCGVVGCLIHRGCKGVEAEAAKPSRLQTIPVVAIVALLAYCGLTWQAFVPGENVRISCKMQNLMIEEDWEGMTEAALTCKQPSRSVAAFYVISLVQQNNLLDRVFDIPYNYPKIELDNIGGSDEGVNYIADCNLYAGIPNAGYHTSMENHVMLGPRLHNYKRMAICSILSDEKELAERYLHLIGKVPFEQDWVDAYTPYVGHPELLKQNPTFARILELYPREDKFEQNYRQPIFLGYNAGLLSGSDATLLTSVATCMYSKDLNNLLLRTNFLQQKMPTLPTVVQQSIAVASVNREGLLDQYPSCKANRMLISELQSFVTEAHDYLDRMKQTDDTEAKNAVRQEMARDLRENWLGTYYYYYYCGNIDQTVQKAESHGVN